MAFGFQLAAQCACLLGRIQRRKVGDVQPLRVAQVEVVVANLSISRRVAALAGQEDAEVRARVAGGRA